MRVKTCLGTNTVCCDAHEHLHSADLTKETRAMLRLSDLQSEPALKFCIALPPPRSGYIRLCCNPVATDFWWD